MTTKFKESGAASIFQNEYPNLLARGGRRDGCTDGSCGIVSKVDGAVGAREYFAALFAIAQALVELSNRGVVVFCRVRKGDMNVDPLAIKHEVVIDVA